MRFMAVLSGLLLAATVFAQNISTPVFVLKDGDATAAGYSGTDKSIYVDGGTQQSVGWITFQTQGIDVSKIASARLVLYVNALTGPGTLQARLLTADITAPENNVILTAIPAAVAVTTTLALGTTNIGNVIQLDLTAAIKSGTFRGVALTSDDGLVATFDSKEGHLKPMVLLTNNVSDVAAVWLSGTSVPAVGLGKDGDYYLNTASGDVSAKAAGAWSVVTNIVGARGVKGDKGDAGAVGALGLQGPIGLTGPTGATGAAGADGHSPATTSATSLAISRSGNVSVSLAGNRNAFGVGQRLRIASTASPANWMEGVVTGYDASTGVATLARDNSAGSGTYASWTVTVAGTPGRREIPGVVVDIDGNSYTTVIIGNQEWTVQNLRVTRYNDNTTISLVTDNPAWSSTMAGSYCWYNNSTDVATRQKWGALYNWYAVKTGKLAPAGWRVPTDDDWTVLENYLVANGYNWNGTTSGNKIGKSLSAQTDWTVSGGSGGVGSGLAANNRSGFSALGAGYRSGNGPFGAQSSSGYWWSAMAYGVSNAWHRGLYYDYDNLIRAYSNERCGYSVRLLRDLN